MNFLELCQEALVSSDTGNESEIRSFTDLSNYQKQVRSYVNEAWQFIQTVHERWGWRQLEFIAALRRGTDAYDWRDLHRPGSTTRAPLYAIERERGWRDWYSRAPGELQGPVWRVVEPVGEPELFSTALPITFELMRERRLVFRTPARPNAFAASPSKDLIFHPMPDADYLIHGMFVAGVQRLVSENDQPLGIPEDYQNIIKWRAVMMLHASDEAGVSFTFAQSNYAELLTSLERIWLPQITFGAPLA